MLLSPLRCPPYMVDIPPLQVENDMAANFFRMAAFTVTILVGLAFELLIYAAFVKAGLWLLD